jgi:hypothetical protein
MEVVVLLVAIAGVALLVIPRVQRRKSGARRSPSARKPARGRARSRKAAAAPLVAAPAVASWSPPAAAETAGPDLDVWEDDLGWEGGEDGAPSPDAREAWEQWRTTDSPLAPAAAAETEVEAAPAIEPEAAAELPSVERWRAQTDEQEWVEDDDDGLGWEGEEEPPAPPALWNGDRHAPAPAPDSDAWSPAGTLSPAPDAWNSSRDWSRRDETRAPAQDAAPAFATASMTDDAPAADAEEPEAGRTIALDEDDEWAAPVGRSWGAPAPASEPVETAPRRSSRRSRVHPVLLVAVYAAIGIGAVVLASTVLLGGSEPSSSAATATASPTPTAAVKRVAATATPTPVATPDPAIDAAARNDFTRERTGAVRSHDAAVKAAIADRRRAVKKAKERARRAAAAHKEANAARAAATPSSSSSGGGSTSTPSAQSSTPSSPTYRVPATKRRSVCEFCIG